MTDSTKRCTTTEAEGVDRGVTTDRHCGEGGCEIFCKLSCLRISYWAHIWPCFPHSKCWVCFVVCCAAGRRYFREFLRSEYSEENLLFWLACEEMKREDDTRVEDKARIIYEDYISIISPTEVCWLACNRLLHRVVQKTSPSVTLSQKVAAVQCALGFYFSSCWPIFEIFSLSVSRKFFKDAVKDP